MLCQVRKSFRACPIVNLERDRQPQFRTSTKQCPPTTDKQAQTHIPRQPAQTKKKGGRGGLHLQGDSLPKTNSSPGCVHYAASSRTTARALLNHCVPLRGVGRRGRYGSPSFSWLQQPVAQIRPASSCGAVWFCAIGEIGHEACVYRDSCLDDRQHSLVKRRERSKRPRDRETDKERA